jgi:hypothetical protein
MGKNINYFLEEAARVIYRNISSGTRLKYSYGDILQILDFEFDYYRKEGLTKNKDALGGFPVPVDEERKKLFILRACNKIGLVLFFHELEEMLDAELIYLKEIGAIDEEGMQPFCN